jgi:hypothetical protein
MWEQKNDNNRDRCRSGDAGQLNLLSLTSFVMPENTAWQLLAPRLIDDMYKTGCPE